MMKNGPKRVTVILRVTVMMNGHKSDSDDEWPQE